MPDTVAPTFTEREVRADQLRQGDTYLDDGGGEPVKITSLNWHGDTLLVRGWTGDRGRRRVETTLDLDEMVMLVDRTSRPAGRRVPMADTEAVSRGERRSYTIIVSGPDPERAWEAARDAADAIACAIDDGAAPFDVDVIEGTFAHPLSGDNVHGLGRQASDPGDGNG